MSKAATATRKKSLYDVHPGVAMVQNWVATLKEKTGRTLDEWLAHIRKDGPATEKECRRWLKAKYELGTNTAWWLAERGYGNPMGMADEDPDTYLSMADQYVADMYAGAKAGLKPIHDALLKLGRKLGKDAKICPCKTIVPFYRNHVIAQIKPTTRTRIDFGLALGALLKDGKGKKLPKRLVDTGGFAKKDRITHRIVLEKPEEIDAEVEHWLKTAYELDA